jgi:hypothetical protein
MRRLSVSLLIVVPILVVSEIRLSRGEPRYSEPLPPALWENTRPPGRFSPPPTVARSERGLTVAYGNPQTNCVTMLSTNPNSRYELTAPDDGVAFDIDADADLDQVAWPRDAADVALLAIDLDADGRIGSGRELVGDRTVPGVSVSVTALKRLSSHAGTWGTMDSDDPLFAKLRLWRDANHNGISEAGELRPVEDELSAIGMGYTRHRRVDGSGNQSRFRGFVHVRTAPGRNRAIEPEDDRARRRYMYDVCLVVR